MAIALRTETNIKLGPIKVSEIDRSGGKVQHLLDGFRLAPFELSWFEPLAVLHDMKSDVYGFV